eukprot:m.41833 g.41833  ORF g.41833 m.41833 type:complete len:222 (+) comp33271_c0_seq1:3-668(+)
MEYCPWAERTRMALTLKGIKYDIINCNPSRKPKFLTDTNPSGQTPVLLHDGNVICESEVTVEYIDQVFPGIKLYPADAGDRARARVLIINFSSKVVPVMYKHLKDHSEENFADLVDQLEKFAEKPFKELGTPYFGGQQINTIDVNIWPFLERIDAASRGGFSRELPADRLPTLIDYIERMKNTPEIKDVIHSPEDHLHVRKTFLEGKTDFNYKSEHPFYAA